MVDYDVFISCKSEDYPLAEDVYSFLSENHIHAFLASKELRKLGDSEYREVIESALESAEHLIIVASKPEYIMSKYVKYEWGLFLNAKISDYKDGNIITILNGIHPKDIAFALRNYESFSFQAFRDGILSYVETNASIQRTKEAEEEKAKALKRRKEEEEKQQKKKKFKSELVQLAEEYQRYISSLDVLVAKIKAHKRFLGATQYSCPICGSKNDIDSEFCATCGWIFSPIESIEGAEYLTANSRKAIENYQKVFKGLASKTTEQAMINGLKSRNQLLEKENERLRLKIESCDKEKRDIHALNLKIQKHDAERIALIDNLKREIEDLKMKLEKNTNSTISSLINKQELKGLCNRLYSAVQTHEPFSVWITFATAEAENIVKSYNKSFRGFSKNGYGRIINPTNILVSSFSTLEEAENLKRQLEYKGATVKIKENGKEVKFSGDSTCLKTPSVLGMKYESSGIPPKKVFNDLIPSFGIIIKHWGINMNEVIEILSKVYGTSTSLYKCKNLPLKTRPNLTRKNAEDLLIRLGQIGATVELYQV